MAYEVVLSVDWHDLFWGVTGRFDPLEPQEGVTSSGVWYVMAHPTDYLIEWLDEFAPSWSYYYDFNDRNNIKSSKVPYKVVFGFLKSSDAVLFKLTWCNV